MKQHQSGRSFELSLASAFSLKLGLPVVESPELIDARGCMEQLAADDQSQLRWAATAAVDFIHQQDLSKRKVQPTSVALQPDRAGKSGDVRDIVVVLNSESIGVSAKNHHDAIKHSRLSDKIDFGQSWTGHPCSKHYFKKVCPVFEDLRARKQRQQLFRSIADKANRFYLPVLAAFEDEMLRLSEEFGQDFTTRLFRYLLGSHDFYKVINATRHVSIQSFNLGGSLKWGKPWVIPSRIERIIRKRGSSDTLIVSFDGGWQVSFRLHNAASICEPSLKFDIKLIGMSAAVGRHEITADR